MKITKQQLRQMVKEELYNLTEAAAMADPPAAATPAPVPAPTTPPPEHDVVEGEDEVAQKLDRILHILESAFPEHATARFDDPTPGYVA
jgi:hypothetical protein